MNELDPLWINSIVSIISTVAFVIIYLITVYQNRQTIKEMEKARKAEFLPKLKATLHFPASTYANLKIQNIGKGPALNVDATIKFCSSSSESESSRIWKEPLMMAGEYYMFVLPQKGNIKQIIQNVNYIHIKGVYEDIFGEKHEFEDKIDLNEILQNLPEAQIIWKYDPIDKVARTLEKIAEKLDSIGQNL